MQQFIGREDWLNRFKDYLWQEKGVVWRITGQPGIGKSTLLRRFEHTCEHAERLNVWLDLENFTPAQGLEVLAAMESAARFFDVEKTNKGWKEKAGEGFKIVSGSLIGVLELGKDLIPGGGLAVEAVKVVAGLGEDVAGNFAQISENAVAAHHELYLLEALAKAGEKRPVCLIDTYEHILRNDLKIQSRLVLGYGSPRDGNVKTVSLSAWLADVCEYLKDKGWRIVMTGREVPRSKSDDQLPRFSRDEILQAARIRPALAEYLPVQESAIALVLSTLSFKGNPLWLQVAMNLLENLLEKGKDLAQLAAQQSDYLHECFEKKDWRDSGDYEGIEHGRCKLNLINTLTKHIEGLDDQAWKIALPRVLDDGIVAQLFAVDQTYALLRNFNRAGIFRDTGQQFTLHEEIRDLLLAYARSKGWLDTDETRALHGKLWDYLNQTYSKAYENFSFNTYSRDISNYPLTWMAEACYHRIMSGIGLLDKQINPKIFWEELSGAINLSLSEKWQNANDLLHIDQDSIEILRKNLIDDKQRLYQFLDVITVNTLHQDLSNGVIASFWDVNYWQERVANDGTVDDYFVLQEIQKDPVEKIQIIDQMLVKYGNSIIFHVQEKCASALLYKGKLLSDKFDDPEKAVLVYDDLLQRYDNSIPSLQKMHAQALFDKGWIQATKLNDDEGSVSTYDELLQFHGDSNILFIQEVCATALQNKGATLIDKLNRVEDAVSAYNDLLDRFGNLNTPSMQEQCAAALYNKGWMQANKLHDITGAISIYDELLECFGSSTILFIQKQCATALYSKGWMQLNKLSDTAGAMLTYDDLLERFGNSTIPFVQEQCAQALIDKGWIMENKEDPRSALAIYKELLKRYPREKSWLLISHTRKYHNTALLNIGRIFRERLSNETDALEYAVKVYDEVLLNHHYHETLNGTARWQALFSGRYNQPWHNQVLEIQKECVDALFYKGLTLTKLGDSSALREAVEVYSSLARNFGGSTVLGVQEQCAKALFHKGVTLNRMGDVVDAVASYDDLLVRYSQSENPAIQAQCQFALANTVEPLLVWGRSAEAIPRIRQVLARTDAANQLFAIMHFLLWLAEADTAQDDVLAAIRSLSLEVEFTWGWDEIRPLVDKLSEPRKTQAECFIAFFGQHHDIAQLESCLANR